VDEFEPVTLLGVDDVEAERERLRRRRLARSRVATVATTLVLVIVLLAVLANRGMLPRPDTFKPTALEASDLGAPEVPSWALDRGDPAPAARAGVSRNGYELIWTITPVYAGWGGSMLVNVTNRGPADVHIDHVRLVPDWDPTSNYVTGWGRDIPAGGTRTIGLIAFSGPPSAGVYTYGFELEVREESAIPRDQWVRATVTMGGTHTVDVLPASPVPSYPTYHNDPAIYKRVNDLVRPDDPLVAQLATQVSSGLGANYSIYWLASLFDWVTSNLTYIRDPSDDDVWSPPGDTLAIKGGDCEDYSILIASVVEHWGGDARFDVITDHAFAAIYLGPPDMDANAAVAALSGFYGGSARFAWFKDTLGHWLIADGTTAQYLGGLCYNGVPTDTSGSWDITGTEYLYITDIYPDYPV
jgi:transglutaminase-like putative cysteine protease